MLRFTSSVVGLLLLAASAHAACTSPDGEGGELRYAGNLRTMVYCDDTNWVTLNGNTGSSGGGATTLNDLTDVDTSGVASGNYLKYDGSNWVDAAPFGTLTNNKWCTSDGTQVICNTDAPTTTAAGSDTYVQYNDGGTALGAEAAFAYNASTNVLTVPTVSATTFYSGDGAAYFYNDFTNPSLVFDTNDYLRYNRSQNRFGFLVGGDGVCAGERGGGFRDQFGGDL